MASCFRIRANETLIYVVADKARIGADGSLDLLDEGDPIPAHSFLPGEWLSLGIVALAPMSFRNSSRAITLAEGGQSLF